MLVPTIISRISIRETNYVIHRIGIYGAMDGDSGACLWSSTRKEPSGEERDYGVGPWVLVV